MSPVINEGSISSRAIVNDEKQEKEEGGWGRESGYLIHFGGTAVRKWKELLLKDELYNLVRSQTLIRLLTKREDLPHQHPKTPHVTKTWY